MPFKVAPYSFLKSGKHMFQTENLVALIICYKNETNCLVYNSFFRIRNCYEKVRNCGCYGNNDVSKWLLICGKTSLIRKKTLVTPFFILLEVFFAYE